MPKTLPLASLLLCGALFATPALALADEIDCNGRMGRAAIDGDLRVPAGKRCTLDGTRIDGNIKVGRGATLQARGVRVKATSRPRARARSRWPIRGSAATSSSNRAAP